MPCDPEPARCGSNGPRHRAGVRAALQLFFRIPEEMLGALGVAERVLYPRKREQRVCTLEPAGATPGELDRPLEGTLGLLEPAAGLGHHSAREVTDHRHEVLRKALVVAQAECRI